MRSPGAFRFRSSPTSDFDTCRLLKKQSRTPVWGCGFVWLGRQVSNLRCGSQSPMPYRLATAQNEKSGLATSPLFLWGAQRESNPRPPEPQSGALTNCAMGTTSGAPEGTRTPGPLLRRQLLYPAELRAHTSSHLFGTRCMSYYIRSFGICQCFIENIFSFSSFLLPLARFGQKNTAPRPSGRSAVCSCAVRVTSRSASASCGCWP